MRSKIGTKLLAIVGLAIVVVLAWGVYSSIEFYEESEQTPWSLRALRNPYLAAQQFMQQSGINSVEAASLVGLDTLDGISTVLITDANQVVNPRQLEQVLAWLENGGNLIVTANSIGSSGDLLLKEFNVGVSWRSRTGKTEDKDRVNDDQHDGGEADQLDGRGSDSSSSSPSMYG